MDLLGDLALGLQTALTPTALLYCFVGALLGTLIGVLPGIGPTTTVALLLPITFALDPTSSLIMLAGIYYGAQYGGSTTAILINLPGEPSAAVTAIDGYQMARKGRAGAALAAAALGSFFAGTVATLLIALFARPLTELALSFTPPDYFALIVLGVVCSVALARGSLLRALMMIGLGLLLGTAGTDIYSGVPRFTFGRQELADGIDVVALAAGVFGLAEILRNLEDEHAREVMKGKVGGLLLSLKDLKAISWPTLRGTLLGSLVGVLPGGGAVLAAFASYTLEKKLSKHPEQFGHGAIEGVAGPESANNAGAQTSFIPMLTLGIPANAIMALMIGAMIIQGITPGPNVVNQNPALFWGLIASMWVGNLMLVVLNLPLIGLWVKMLTVPYRMLVPVIVVFSVVGVYSTSGNAFELFAMGLFGLLGYLLMKLQFEPAPLVVGFVLGPMLEEHLRRAMILSRGDVSTFFNHPISAILLIASALVLVVLLLPALRKKRDEVFVAD